MPTSMALALSVLPAASRLPHTLLLCSYLASSLLRADRAKFLGPFSDGAVPSYLKGEWNLLVGGQIKGRQDMHQQSGRLIKPVSGPDTWWTGSLLAKLPAFMCALQRQPSSLTQPALP